jgi:hypothetical protein
VGSHPPCCVGCGLVSRLGVALEEHSDTVGSGIGASAEVASVACHAPLFVLQNKSISRSCWACECVKRQPMPGEVSIHWSEDTRTTVRHPARKGAIIP